MRWWWLGCLGAVAWAGCARCGNASLVDAGAHRPPHVRRSSDLRSVLLLIFPEYRGTHLVEGHASLVRRVQALPSEGLEAWAKTAGYRDASDGGLERSPFHLTSEGDTTLRLSLEVDDATAGKVFGAPVGITSMDMGLYLPRGLATEEERYEVVLHHVAATPQRGGFLARQVVELLLGNGQWKVDAFPEGWGAMPADGGQGEVPERFELHLTDLGNGARITLARAGADVRVRYELETEFAPQPR